MERPHLSPGFGLPLYILGSRLGGSGGRNEGSGPKFGVIGLPGGEVNALCDCW